MPRRSSNCHILNSSPHPQALSTTTFFLSLPTYTSHLVLAPGPTERQEQAMACMAPHSTCPFFLKVVLVFLPYTVTGNNESIEPSFFPTCCASAEVRSRSAWVAPRMTCVRQRDRKSPPMPTWHAGHAMSPVAYEGRNDGNGAAGNQASVHKHLLFSHCKLQSGTAHSCEYVLVCHSVRKFKERCE